MPQTVVVHNLSTGHTLQYDHATYAGVAGARRALIAADRYTKGDGNWWNYPEDDARIRETSRFLFLGDWVVRHPANRAAHGATSEQVPAV